VALEMLPGSTLRDELRQLGDDVSNTVEGQRILPTAIEQKLTLTSSGAYETLVEVSSKPVAQIRTHAGITRVLRYSFTMERRGQAVSGLRGKAEVLGSVRG
jgi:hypothetical protein